MAPSGLAAMQLCFAGHIMTWHLQNLPPTTVNFLCVNIILRNRILEKTVKTVNTFTGVICHIPLPIKARPA